MREPLLASVRFYFAQSVFMNNCHYKAYGRYEKRRDLNSNIVIGFSAVTIILLVLQVIGLENANQGLLNVIAFIGLILTGASLVFELMNKEDISTMMHQHRDSAEKYKRLRDKYMSLIADLMSDNVDEATLTKKRNKLLKEYGEIGANAPTTSVEDYSKAQESLGLKGNDDEEFTWSNKEINKFLPSELHVK